MKKETDVKKRDQMDDASMDDRPNTKRRKGKGKRDLKGTRCTPRATKYNDVNWYVPSDRLLRDSASLSYNNPLGNSLRVSELSDFSMGGVYNTVNNLDTPIPGLMAIHSAPGVGFSNSQSSPISLAAKSLYARVRKDNAGAKNYDPADLIKYIVGLDSAICLYGFASRIYGCLSLYSAYNRYWPRAVVRANNVDFNDMLGHIADFRYFLNAYALKINSLFMPNNMNIVPRHFFMYSGLWKDTDVEKAQLFVHVPDWVYMYNEQVTPARLDPVYLADGVQVTTPMTFAYLTGIMETVANALLVSEDIGIISGDLMKAFGAETGFKLSEIPSTFEVIPVYNEDVLAQIQAIKFMGRIDDMVSMRITESTAADDTLGCILCTPHSTGVEALPNIAHPINFYKDDVTPENTMEASRLMAFGKRVVTADSGGGFKVDNTFDTVGSEYPLYFEIWYNDSTGVPNALVIQGESEFVNYYDQTGAGAVDQLYSAAANFDHCPLIDRITWAQTTGVTTFGQPWALFDFSNYTIVNSVSVGKMHETAFLSLFGIDTLAKL